MFYERVTTLCKLKGMTISHLVTKELCMGISNVTKWKNGSVPKASTVKKIADYFNISTAYLLDDTDLPVGYFTFMLPIRFKDIQIALYEPKAEELTDKDIFAIVQFVNFLKSKYKK